jgi:hypothetical protein
VPEALLAQWRAETPRRCDGGFTRERTLMRLAAAWAWAQREEEVRAAADAELESCLAWLDGKVPGYITCELRAARRPAHLTLREQALTGLRARLNDTSTLRGTYDNDAMVLALQALQECADG